MIRQKFTKTITGTYTTTDSDNGYRIICNSASPFTITLHSATGRYNYELEIDNIGAGEITCGGQVIPRYSHAHVGNDDGTAWVVVIGGGGSGIGKDNPWVDAEEDPNAIEKDTWVDIDNPTIDDGLSTAGVTLTWSSERQINTTGDITLPDPTTDKNIDGNAVDHTGVVMFCIRNNNSTNGMIVVNDGLGNVLKNLFPNQSVTIRTGITQVWEVV
jgi:hypothetical protein